MNNNRNLTVTDLFKIFFPFTAFLMITSLTFSNYLLNFCEQDSNLFSDEICQTSEKFFVNTAQLTKYEMIFISFSIFAYLFSFIPSIASKNPYSNRISKWAQLFSLFVLFIALLLVISPFVAQIIPIPHDCLLFFSVVFDILVIYGISKKIEY